MPGPFIKPWFQYSKPDEDEVAIASIAWGATLACSVMSAAQAVRQTRRSWRRLQKANGYIVLVWLEWMANVVMGIITFCLLRGIYDLRYVPPVSLPARPPANPFAIGLGTPLTAGSSFAFLFTIRKLSLIHI